MAISSPMPRPPPETMPTRSGIAISEKILRGVELGRLERVFIALSTPIGANGETDWGFFSEEREGDEENRRVWIEGPSWVWLARHAGRTALRIDNEPCRVYRNALARGMMISRLC